MPVLLLFLLFGIQSALYFHTAQLATIAAQEGAIAGAIVNGSEVQAVAAIHVQRAVGHQRGAPRLPLQAQLPRAADGPAHHQRVAASHRVDGGADGHAGSGRAGAGRGPALLGAPHPGRPRPEVHLRTQRARDLDPQGA